MRRKQSSQDSQLQHSTSNLQQQNKNQNNQLIQSACLSSIYMNQVPKSKLQIARNKMISSQSLNFFGGLSRHVINAAASQTTKNTTMATPQQNQQKHFKNGGSMSSRLSPHTIQSKENDFPLHQHQPQRKKSSIQQKTQANVQNGLPTSCMHNTNYFISSPDLKNNRDMQRSSQPSYKSSILITTQMQQQQPKMRKSESQKNSGQITVNNQHHSYRIRGTTSATGFNASSVAAIKNQSAAAFHSIIQTTPKKQKKAVNTHNKSEITGSQQHLSSLQTKPVIEESQHLQQHCVAGEQKKDQLNYASGKVDIETDLSYMQGVIQTAREPHSRCEPQNMIMKNAKSSQNVDSRLMYPITQAHQQQILSSRSTLISPQSQNNDPALVITNTFDCNPSTICRSMHEDMMVLSQDPFSMPTPRSKYVEECDEEELMMEDAALPERDSTPERTTPQQKQRLNEFNTIPNQATLQLQGGATVLTSNVGVGVHICCHAESKQQAILIQKLQFMSEQVLEEKRKAEMKEQQYSKIIGALNQSVVQKSAAHHTPEKELVSDQNDLVLQDRTDLLNELKDKKEEVNRLEDRILELELKAEKIALETKNKIQEKDDEVSEYRLKFKHKESDLRQSNAQITRLNEDIQSRIQEALDRQSDRLASEKQADIEAINRRNEMLIKQLIEGHSAEARQLRELLLQQDRKSRDTEQRANYLEIENQALKQEKSNSFDPSELEDIQQMNEIQIQALRGQFQEENQQLMSIVDQLKSHINMVQQNKNESDRQLLIAHNKIAEVKKELGNKNVLIASQKQKEQKMQETFKNQIVKERKTADMAVSKMRGVQKLEQEINKKSMQINKLKARIYELEREEVHKNKILLMKRSQIEDEKTDLIKKQALRQKSMSRQNISTTRLQQQLDTKQAVIDTERQSKKALQYEKSKLEKEIQMIKKEKTIFGGNPDSSRLNESMSVYFVRSLSKNKNYDPQQSSHFMFSPRKLLDQQKSTSKSSVLNSKKGLYRSQQFNMSQHQSDRNQLRLSKHFSGERNSSVGGPQSICGDSMVNVVEFDEPISVKSRKRCDLNSILSTPPKYDEPNDRTQRDLTYNMAKMAYSKSVVLDTSASKVQKTITALRGNIDIDDEQDNDFQLQKHIKPKQDGCEALKGSGTAHYQTKRAGISHTSHKELGQMMKQTQFKKYKNADKQAIGRSKGGNEFVNVITGGSIGTYQSILGGVDIGNSAPADQATYISGIGKVSYDDQEQQSQEMQKIYYNKHIQHQNYESVAPISKNEKASSSIARQLQNLTNQSTSLAVQRHQRTPSSRSNVLMASLMNKDSSDADHLVKESFVKTVLNARHQCSEFNSTIRQKQENSNKRLTEQKVVAGRRSTCSSSMSTKMKKKQKANVRTKPAKINPKEMEQVEFIAADSETQKSDRLMEENNLLKEQLQLIQQTLTVQQQKAENTEITMMDAILQMKEQILKVSEQKEQKGQQKQETMVIKDEQNIRGLKNVVKKMGSSSEAQKDYLVMSTTSSAHGSSRKRNLTSNKLLTRKKQGAAYQQIQQIAATQQK